MTAERTQMGREVEAALGEVLAHVRGEADLPCRIVDDPRCRAHCRTTKAHETEPSEVCGPVRPRRPRRAGLGTGAPRTGPRRPCAADCHRPRPRGGRASARQVTDVAGPSAASPIAHTKCWQTGRGQTER